MHNITYIVWNSVTLSNNLIFKDILGITEISVWTLILVLLLKRMSELSCIKLSAKAYYCTKFIIKFVAYAIELYHFGIYIIKYKCVI